MGAQAVRTIGRFCPMYRAKSLGTLAYTWLTPSWCHSDKHWIFQSRKIERFTQDQLLFIGSTLPFCRWSYGCVAPLWITLYDINCQKTSIWYETMMKKQSAVILSGFHGEHCERSIITLLVFTEHKSAFHITSRYYFTSVSAIQVNVRLFIAFIWAAMHYARAVHSNRDSWHLFNVHGLRFDTWFTTCNFLLYQTYPVKASTL